MMISWSDDDQAYIVSVPDLPGCMADGKTPDEAVKMLKLSSRSGSNACWRGEIKFRSLLHNCNKANATLCWLDVSLGGIFV